jgi:hypothetical protein
LNIDVVAVCKALDLDVVPVGSRWTTTDGFIEVSFFDGASIAGKSMWGVLAGHFFASHYDLETVLKKAIAFGGPRPLSPAVKQVVEVGLAQAKAGEFAEAPEIDESA